MARTFKSLVPKLGRGDSAAPRTPGKPVSKEQLDAAAQKRAAQDTPEAQATQAEADPNKAKEVGGPEGPEPTRYGDWERGGICYDF